ncbi:MAG: hypothetical protein JWN86_441 [Planctomycetota bacterium]|nr:hypothetical protein [Planctomycetota bacterium]
MANLRSRLKQAEALAVREIKPEPKPSWIDFLTFYEGRTIHPPDLERALFGVVKLAVDAVGGWRDDYSESSPATVAVTEALARIDELLHQGGNTEFAVNRWKYENFAASYQDARASAIRYAFGPKPPRLAIVPALPSMAGREVAEDLAEELESGFRSVAIRAAEMVDPDWQGKGLNDRIVSAMGDALAMVDDKIRNLRWSPGDAVRQWHNTDGRLSRRAS